MLDAADSPVLAGFLEAEAEVEKLLAEWKLDIPEIPEFAVENPDIEELAKNPEFVAMLEGLVGGWGSKIEALLDADLPDADKLKMLAALQEQIDSSKDVRLALEVLGAANSTAVLEEFNRQKEELDRAVAELRARLTGEWGGEGYDSDEDIFREWGGEYGGEEVAEEEEEEEECEGESSEECEEDEDEWEGECTGEESSEECEEEEDPKAKARRLEMLRRAESLEEFNREEFIRTANFMTIFIMGVVLRSHYFVSSRLPGPDEISPDSEEAPHLHPRLFDASLPPKEAD